MPRFGAHSLRLLPSASVLLIATVGAFWLGRITAGGNRPARETVVARSQTLPTEVNLSEGKILSAVPTDSLNAWSESDWLDSISKPASHTRNKGLAHLLADLARNDPGRAMQLAHAERNLVLRETLIQAALAGWATAAPDDAAKWACALDDQAKRSTAMEVIFTSAAASRPEEAVMLGRELFRKDPAAATGYGCSLIDALCVAGNFETAVTFASDPGVNDPAARSILLAKTCSAWATMQPEIAGRAAAALNDPALRNEALNAVVGGWGQADPVGLTQFVARLPAGPERIPLMGQALRAWSQVDAAAAANWVKTNDIGPGLDDGVAAMAGAGFLEPAEAAGWTRDIASPALRSQTLLTVLRSWANTDPNAARQYFEKTNDLQPADRAHAAALFAPPGGF